MKNSSIENRFCMSLVAFAVIVRLLLATGAAAAVDEAFGRAPQAQAPEPDILTLEILAAPEPIVPPEPEPQPEAEPEPASEPEPEPTYTPPVFSAEEADGIRIAGACSYTPDKQTLLLQPSSLDFQQDGPTVLIVHTHSSEAYTMEAGFEYPESDELRTQDSRYSVIRIGDEIAQILQDAGIEVLHDTEPNDYPNYNGAYERMRQTIEGYLAAYPTIQMVLDLHRDAAEDAGGRPCCPDRLPGRRGLRRAHARRRHGRGRSPPPGLAGESGQRPEAAGASEPQRARALPGSRTCAPSGSTSMRRRGPCSSRSAPAAIRWPRRSALPASSQTRL